ncbi:sigma factor [Plesiomonas shigelloides]|nr:sigma factor [Plesiomonas shigelloides]
MCGAADNAQGLNAYQTSQKLGRQALEQRLLLQHAPLVRRIAYHLAPQVSAVLGRDDLEQIGMLALLGEIRRYDPDGDVPLEVMASPVFAVPCWMSCVASIGARAGCGKEP